MANMPANKIKRGGRLDSYRLGPSPREDRPNQRQTKLKLYQDDMVKDNDLKKRIINPREETLPTSRRRQKR
jgi:hypothetical protein